jgi:hydroxymethylpyrimidine pyrophosphatase-like HAD family hydrolase
MGKPFWSELQKLPHSYEYLINKPVDKLSNFLLRDNQKKMIAVGSGGSLSACALNVSLQKGLGNMCLAMTPLELLYSQKLIKDSKVLFISASGRNNDILNGYNKAIKCDPFKILNFCMKENSKLETLSVKYTISKTFSTTLPSGKDGFLATNSLFAYFMLLIRAHTPNLSFPGKKVFFDFDQNLFNNLELNGIETFIVLHSGYGTPVAIDIESKFVEAALGNVQLSDYRNFGHGRHHWLAKHSRKSAVIALITEKEVELANKTLSCIPGNVPILRLTSDYESSLSSLDLLYKSFLLVNRIGEIRNIDPGRPGVPEFGSKLYNLRYARFYNETSNLGFSRDKHLAICKKTGAKNIHELPTTYLKKVGKAHDDFKKIINRGHFGAVAFDYDGTLCDANERYEGPRLEIANKLKEILEGGFLVAIITGRGKSVRKDLQKCLPKKYWRKTIIGYYNGGQSSFLDDENSPKTLINPDDFLSVLESHISDFSELDKSANITLRPGQLSVEWGRSPTWALFKNKLDSVIADARCEGYKVFESSHSIDIIPQSISKLNTLSFCEVFLKKHTLPSEILCIGDKGRWPGNDSEFLKGKYSLSVDEVSSDLTSCWNFSKDGIRNVEATLAYLKAIRIGNKGIKIKI